METQKPNRFDVRKPAKPARYSTTTAAEKLDLTPGGVRDLIAEGVLTPIEPNGRGRGKRLYLYPDEVDLLATSTKAVVIAYRREKGRLPAAD